MADYHVAKTGSDSAPGTAAQPWLTIEKANTTLQPGDTVYIHAGTYYDLITPSRSGAVGSPITYARFLTDVVVVAGRSLNEPGVVAIGWVPALYDGDNHGYIGPARSNIVIDGLTLSYEWSQDDAFSAQDGSNRIGHVHIDNYSSQNIVIRNCKIYQAGDGRTNYVSDYRQAGILYAGSGALFENNEIHGMWLGVWLAGAAPRNCIIRNNHIYDNGSSCIDVGSPGSTTIQGTLIEQNLLGPTWNEDGIQFEPDYNQGHAISNCGTIIRKNVFVDIAENCVDLKGAGYVVIEDNVAYGDPGQDDGGIRLDYRDGQYKSGSQTWAQWKDEYGQWVVYEAQNRSGGKGFMTLGYGDYATHIIIRNNIIYDCLGALGPIEQTFTQFKVYNNTFIGNNRDYTGSNSAYGDGLNRDGFQSLTIYGDGGQADYAYVHINNLSVNHNDGEVSINFGGFASSVLRVDYNAYGNINGARICSPGGGVATFYDLEGSGGWKDVTGIDQNSQDVPWDQFVSVPAYPTGDHTQYDFNLKTGSVLRGAGTPLTTTTAPGSGTTITVGDADLFHYGYGITTGDSILVGADPVAYTVTNVQAGTSLVLDRSTVGISSGADVTLVRLGMTPDIGAMLDLTTNPQPPIVSLSPLTLSVVKGATATFSVSVSSASAVTYEWFKNNVSVPSATGSTYSFVTVLADNGATIKCEVTNDVGTTTSATATLSVSDQSVSVNLLTNGNFSSGLTGWSFYSDNEDITGEVVSEKFELNASGTGVGTNVQLNQTPIAIELGTDYRLTFTAYASASRTLQVLLHMDGTPYSGLGLDQEADLTTSPQTFTMLFTGLADHANGRLRFWFTPYTQAGDTFYIDNVILEEVVDIPPPTDYDLGYSAGYAAGLASVGGSTADVAGMLATIATRWLPNAAHPWMLARPK